MRLWHKVALLLIAAATLPLGTAGFSLIAHNAARARVGGARHARSDGAARRHRRRRRGRRARAAAGADGGDDHAGTRCRRPSSRARSRIVKRQTRASVATFQSDADASPSAAPAGLDAPFERARKEGIGAVVYSAPYQQAGAPMLSAATAVRGGVLALAIPLGALSRRLDEVRDDAAAGARARRCRRRADRARRAPRRRGAARRRARRRRRRRPRRTRAPLRRRAAPGRLRARRWARLVARRRRAGRRSLRRRARAAPPDARRHRRRRRARARRGARCSRVASPRALERLSEAARAVGAGKLDARVALDADDEVGTLARSFNRMGEELAAGPRRD